jgi:hypothetical protein
MADAEHRDIDAEDSDPREVITRAMVQYIKMNH